MAVLPRHIFLAAAVKSETPLAYEQLAVEDRSEPKLPLFCFATIVGTTMPRLVVDEFLEILIVD